MFGRHKAGGVGVFRVMRRWGDMAELRVLGHGEGHQGGPSAQQGLQGGWVGECGSFSALPAARAWLSAGLLQLWTQQRGHAAVGSGTAGRSSQ